MDGKTKHIIAISDTHFGSAVALCPKFQQDDGGFHEPSVLQNKLWALWENFWDWALEKVKGSEYVVVHVGDVVDGVHHKATGLVTHNHAVQRRIAIQSLQPKIAGAKAYYQIRGTEAHVGSAGENEETIAEILGAEADKETGAFSHWELWMDYGGPNLVHFAHHIGATSSAAYESSALMREITASFVEAGRWGLRPPTLIVRGHTHRHLMIKHASCYGVKLPAWQAKTPFVYKIDRMRGPEFGGIVISAKEDHFTVHEKIYPIKQTKGVKM